MLYQILGWQSHCRWFGEKLDLLPIRIKFFFDAWVELFHPTKGRLRLHSQRVELHITPSLLWSCQQITGVYRGCHLQGREGALNSKAQVVLCKLLYSLGLVLLVCEMGITLVPQDYWEG